MTTQATEKPVQYLFDQVFAIDEGEKGSTGPAINAAALKRAVDTARTEAHAAGVAEGRQLGKDTIEAQLAKSLDNLVSKTGGLIARAEADRQKIEATATRLATSIASQLAPQLVAREPAAEIAALLDRCLSDIREVPHIAIRVSEDLVEPMRQKFEELAAKAGFAGRAVVMGEPDIAPGDGRIEWADGGIVRDMTEMQNAIEIAVTEYLGPNADPGGSTTQPDTRDKNDG